MAAVVYTLCFLTSSLCAFLLFQSYRRTKVRLLFWSTAGFVGLALSNLLLIMDRIVFPDVEMSVARLLPAAIGLALMTYGFVMEEP